MEIQTTFGDLQIGATFYIYKDVPWQDKPQKWIYKEKENWGNTHHLKNAWGINLNHVKFFQDSDIVYKQCGIIIHVTILY